MSEEEEEQRDAEIVQMPKAGPLLTIRRETYTGCRHYQVEIDEKQRTVWCVTCKIQLDPVSVLCDFANRARRISHEVHELKRLRAEHKKVEDAKKKRQEARASSMPAFTFEGVRHLTQRLQRSFVTARCGAGAQRTSVRWTEHPGKDVPCVACAKASPPPTTIIGG